MVPRNPACLPVRLALNSQPIAWTRIFEFLRPMWVYYEGGNGEPGNYSRLTSHQAHPPYMYIRNRLEERG